MELRSLVLECDLACQEANEMNTWLSFFSDPCLKKRFFSDDLMGQQNKQEEPLTRSWTDNERKLLGSNCTVLSGLFVDSFSETMETSDHTGAGHALEPQSHMKHRTEEEHVMQPALPLSSNVDCTVDGDGVLELALRATPERFMETALAAPNRLPSPHTRSTPAMPEGPAQMHVLDAGVTTLLIRHIPQSVSQQDLLEMWPPNWGYNLLHLPYSIKQRRSCGYAFINFVSNESAQMFYNTWQGWNFTLQGRTKSLFICAALVQGLMPNLQHLQQNGIGSVINDKYLPALFIRERRISFKSVFQQMGDERLLPGTSQESYLNPQEMEW